MFALLAPGHHTGAWRVELLLLPRGSARTAAPTLVQFVAETISGAQHPSRTSTSDQRL